MVRTVFALALVASLAVAASGCRGDGRAPSVVSGQAALGSFPRALRFIRAMAGGRPVASAPVASDGSFLLEVPPGGDYRLELVGDDQTFPIVFPRGEALVDHAFSVRHEATVFELGVVRFVGDVHARPIVVLREVERQEVGCPGGLDPVSGALCVDDEPRRRCGTRRASPSEPPPDAAVPEHNLPSELGCEP